MLMPKKKGKKQSMIIAGRDECKNCGCMNSIEGDNNRFSCSYKNKTYFIGQYIPCDKVK